MSYDVYWVKNRADKIADFEHPTQRAKPLVVSSRLAFLNNGESQLYVKSKYNFKIEKQWHKKMI